MKSANTQKTEKAPEKERVVIKGFAGQADEETKKTPAATSGTTTQSPTKSKEKDKQSNPIKSNPQREGNADWDKDEELNNPDHTRATGKKTN